MPAPSFENNAGDTGRLERRRAFLPAAGRALTHLTAAIPDIVFPRHCAVCGEWTGAGGRVLCWDCRARLRWIAPPFCRRCGDPIEGAADHVFACRLCLKNAPEFDMARSLTRYLDPCRALIRRFKYGGGCWIAGELAAWLHEGARLHFPVERIDAVTEVPLAPRKRRERTYNQAQLLARGLARHLGIPHASCLRRQRYTATQTRLNMAARRRNVRGAFAARFPEWIDGRRILLVDDVMTTGATIGECAAVLRRAGAGAVYALTVARG